MRKVLVAGVAATLLGGCMHHKTYGESSGDVAIDSLTATRTALLRVDNSSASAVRVYTIVGGQANYVARAEAGVVHTWVLDPNLFPNNAISFEARFADGSASRKLGPFTVNKNETVEFVIPSDVSLARATIHKSTP